LTANDLAVAIPTYARESVLVDTLRSVLAQGPGELLVVDQTPHHSPGTQQALESLAEGGKILWIRLPRPSITRAMNTALLRASSPIVLFLDDDIEPAAGLLEAHVDSYTDEGIWAVAGQVLQPGEEPDAGPADRSEELGASLRFRFNSAIQATIRNGMAGNLSLRRQRALSMGGFDENFVGVAYRFETEFCRRLCDAGGRILFQPRASIHHLRHASGGTRAFGSHLTSASPAHGVGDYYFALQRGVTLGALSYLLRRPFREVATRFHMRHPWWIPVKTVGELLAFLWALGLSAKGARLIPNGSRA
jgi:GT2 family glycosyltransferase